MYSNAGGGDPLAAVKTAIFDATGVNPVNLTLYDKSDSNSGNTSTTGGGGTSGTWSANLAIAYITIKAANSFALYQLDPQSTSGTWTTAGILNNGGQQPGESHISFWTADSSAGGPPAPVPEPDTMLLLGGGLLALGVVKFSKPRNR